MTMSILGVNSVADSIQIDVPGKADLQIQQTIQKNLYSFYAYITTM